MSDMPEPVARRILERAITENRCSEMLTCLFEGGAVTVDGGTGELVLLPASAFAHLLAEQE